MTGLSAGSLRQRHSIMLRETGGRSSLTRFIDDGRIELDSNIVERSIRPIALNRKSALFTGFDAGAGTLGNNRVVDQDSKLNDVEPLAYLSEILTKIVNGHPDSQIYELLPWAYAAKPELKPAA